MFRLVVCLALIYVGLTLTMNMHELDAHVNFRIYSMYNIQNICMKKKISFNTKNRQCYI